MLRIRVKNSKNESLNLTRVNGYEIVAVTGINPPTAEISTTPMATDDGAEFNNARVPGRNIVLTINPVKPVEKARQALYPYFMPKSLINLRLISDERDVEIDGYVESFDVDYNANPQMFQVSIICPSPYFSRNHTQLKVLTPGDSITVNNEGDVNVGTHLELTITGTVTSIAFYNLTTGQHLYVLDADLVSGDKVDIYTEPGNKKILLTRNGTTSSLLSKLDFVNSDWIVLAPGNNSVGFSATDNLATGKLHYTALYGGI